MSHSRAWRRGRTGGAAVVVCTTVSGDGEGEGRKEGRKEGCGGVWLPTFVGLKSQSSWRNRGGWRGLSYRLPITI